MNTKIKKQNKEISFTKIDVTKLSEAFENINKPDASFDELTKAQLTLNSFIREKLNPALNNAGDKLYSLSQISLDLDESDHKFQNTKGDYLEFGKEVTTTYSIDWHGLHREMGFQVTLNSNNPFFNTLCKVVTSLDREKLIQAYEDDTLPHSLRKYIHKCTTEQVTMVSGYEDINN